MVGSQLESRDLPAVAEESGCEESRASLLGRSRDQTSEFPSISELPTDLSTHSLRKVDIRLPGNGNSNSRGARPVYSFR